MNQKLIRAISLVFVMVCGLVFCVILWIGYKQLPYMIVPAVGFTGVYIWFILMEIWGALTGVKQTLSTRLNHWVKEHPVLGISSIICFGISMIALCIHFGFSW